MEQTDKKQSMDIANAPLDTNTLRPIGYPFDEEKDDSFAAEFERYIHKEANRIIQEEKDRSFEEDERNAFAVSSWGDKGPSPDSMVRSANKFFEILHRHVAEHMQAYLLQHEGRVKQWPDPDTSMAFGFTKDGYKFRYHYFGGEYSVQNGKIVREEGDAYCSRYVYPKAIRDEHTRRLEREFSKAHDRSPFLEKEDRALKTARSALNTAKAKDEELGARVGLVLTGLLVLLAGLATAIGLGLPIDLLAAATFLTDFFKGVWTALPKVLNFIVCALLAIPLYALVIVLGFTHIVGTIIRDFALMGTGWAIGCYVLLWGAVLVAAIFLGLPLLFKKSPLPAAQKTYDDALAAYSQKKAEYERMERELKESDAYKKAQEEDRRESEFDQANQAANEAFAERWQRAWFEAVKAR